MTPPLCRHGGDRHGRRNRSPSRTRGARDLGADRQNGDWLIAAYANAEDHGHHRATRSRQDFIVTDAAFAEAKGALGGYNLIEAATWMTRWPWPEQVPSRFGCLDVRPVREVG